MADTDYISCVETAKLIRKALKRLWPTTKFSVRSDQYAGGASIRVSWVDGPTDAQVSEITGPFAGSNFDGMIDMAVSSLAWLEDDGTASHAYGIGTGGQRGSIPETIGSRRTPGARLVHFLADYVFTEREYSAEFLKRREARVAGRPCTDSHGPGSQCAQCGHWSNAGYLADDIRGSTRWVCSVECGARFSARRVAAVR